MTKHIDVADNGVLANVIAAIKTLTNEMTASHTNFEEAIQIYITASNYFDLGLKCLRSRGSTRGGCAQ